MFLRLKMEYYIYLSADVGGNMGLFVGASLISLTEILELCVEMFVLKLRNVGQAMNGQTTKQQTTKVVPLK